MKHLSLTILLILTLFLGLTNNILGQEVSFHGGVNYGNQFTFNKNEPNVSNDFEWGKGYSIGVSLNDVQFNTDRKHTFYLGLESYGGGFDTGNFGLGGGSSKSGDYQKYVVDFEYYPWKINLLENLFLLPGFEINGTVAKKVNGTYYQYQMGTSIPSVDLGANKGFVGPFNVGSNINLGYKLKYKSLKVSPSYKFSFFLIPELNLGVYTFSHRHSFLLSFGFELK